ncbi:MAG: glycosyltransferase family 4 protein [Schleiferiaceae bacterium]
MPKRILVATYYWPPAGGPGVQRWLKTAQALKQLGHDVEVLTVDPAYATYPLRDESLTAEAEGITVHSTRARDWFGTYQKLTRRKEVPFSGFANQAGKPGPIQRLSRWVRGNLFIPDPRRGWNPYAVAEALKQHAINPYDLVVTSGPPHSSHLIGLELQRRGLRWWADFRDPWTDIYYYRMFYPSAWARRRDTELERSVLERAERVLTVSDDLKRLLASKLNGDSGKFLVVPNGYDPADFVADAPVPNNPVRTLVYTGTLTLDYPLEALYTALRTYCRQHGALKLVFAGRPAQEAKDALESLARELPLSVEFKGYLPHAESVALLQGADALLLLIPELPNNRGILTGKLFEYLGSGRPIWGFGPVDGDANAIVRETHAGALFEDAHKASEALAQWPEQGASLEARTRYTRLGIAEGLAAYLDK